MYTSRQSSESLRQLVLLTLFTDKQTGSETESPPGVTQLEVRSGGGWI